MTPSAAAARRPLANRSLGGRRGNVLLWGPAALYLLVFFIGPLIGNARLSLGVSNIEDAIRYLSSRGVQATPAKQEVGGLLSLFHDPDGNELCLWQSS